MNEYKKIEKALIFIAENYKKQPTLKQIAGSVEMNEYNFQKLFTAWAGISPKQFLSFININNAKKLIISGGSLTDATYNIGLSSTSRLHDLFVNITAMTPAEYKNKGANLNIIYSFNLGCFGEYLIASTNKGICDIIFGDNKLTLIELKRKWKNATFTEQSNAQHKLVNDFIENKINKGEKIKLHLKGTNFQLSVWEALLKIPENQLTTYSSIAYKLNSKAYRAVGTAIGNNPIAYIIPCHRVIKSTGEFGNYRWGTQLKIAMIGLENKQQRNITI